MNSVLSPNDKVPGQPTANKTVDGEFLDFAGERFYVIRNVDQMAPFFVSVISAYDHWLFASSTGGLTAGRVSPETALFPYITVDKLHDCANSTGPRTVLRVGNGTNAVYWEPFNKDQRSLNALS